MSRHELAALAEQIARLKAGLAVAERRYRVLAQTMGAGTPERARQAVHGTVSGYARHRRRPDPLNGWPKEACAPCRAAHALEVKNGQDMRRARERQDDVRRSA